MIYYCLIAFAGCAGCVVTQQVRAPPCPQLLAHADSPTLQCPQGASLNAVCRKDVFITMIVRAVTTVGAVGGMLMSYNYAPMIICAMKDKPATSDDDDASVKVAALNCAEDTTADIELIFSLILLLAGTLSLVYLCIASCKTSTRHAYQGLQTPPIAVPPTAAACDGAAAVGDDQI